MKTISYETKKKNFKGYNIGRYTEAVYDLLNKYDSKYTYYLPKDFIRRCLYVERKTPYEVAMLLTSLAFRCIYCMKYEFRQMVNSVIRQRKLKTA